jgi:hypothetical protein
LPARGRPGLGKESEHGSQDGRFSRNRSGHLATLKTAGIENTDDLMKLWTDKTKRAALVASTGIAEGISGEVRGNGPA